MPYGYVVSKPSSFPFRLSVHAPISSYCEGRHELVWLWKLLSLITRLLWISYFVIYVSYSPNYMPVKLYEMNCICTIHNWTNAFINSFGLLNYNDALIIGLMFDK